MSRRLKTWTSGRTRPRPPPWGHARWDMHAAPIGVHAVCEMESCSLQEVCICSAKSLQIQNKCAWSLQNLNHMMQKVCKKCAKSVHESSWSTEKVCKKSAKSVHFIKKVCKKSVKSFPDADFADSCRLLKKSARVCPPMNLPGMQRPPSPDQQSDECTSWHPRDWSRHYNAILYITQCHTMNERSGRARPRDYGPRKIFPS